MQRGGAENGLRIAVKTAFGLDECGLQIKAKLDFKRAILQRAFQFHQWHRLALVDNWRVGIAPLMDAHLLADQIDMGCRAFAQILATAEQIDRYRRLVPVCHGSDNVSGGRTPHHRQRRPPCG